MQFKRGITMKAIDNFPAHPTKQDIESAKSHVRHGKKHQQIIEDNNNRWRDILKQNGTSTSEGE